MLGSHPRVWLVEPLGYEPFVLAMKSAHVIPSDFGGIQEEAPALGKPVLVLRNTTERPEAVEAGTARLVGTEVDAIVSACEQLLTDPNVYRAMAQAKNPFGDGHASERILDVLAKSLVSVERRDEADEARTVEGSPLGVRLPAEPQVSAGPSPATLQERASAHAPSDHILAERP